MRKLLIVVYMIFMLFLVSCNSNEVIDNELPINNNSQQQQEQEETNKIDDAEWKAAYLNYVQQSEYFKTDIDGYALLNIDNDDVPELVLSMNDFIKVASYYNGQVESITLKGLDYIENQGLLMYEHTYPPKGYESEAVVYKLEQGRFEKIWEGSQSSIKIEDSGDELKSNLDTVNLETKYYISGQECSKEVYNNSLQAVFDTSIAVNLYEKIISATYEDVLFTLGYEDILYTLRKENPSKEAYISVLENIYHNNVLPNGAELYGLNDNSIENRFAIFDVDFDGKEELLFSYESGAMADIMEFIYDYDLNSNTVVLEAGFNPMSEFYDTGIVYEEAKHNQDFEDPWPYTLYKYNSLIDKYEVIESGEKYGNIIEIPYQIFNKENIEKLKNYFDERVESFYSKNEEISGDRLKSDFNNVRLTKVDNYYELKADLLGDAKIENSILENAINEIKEKNLEQKEIETVNGEKIVIYSSKPQEIIDLHESVKNESDYAFEFNEVGIPTYYDDDWLAAENNEEWLNKDGIPMYVLYNGMYYSDYWALMKKESDGYYLYGRELPGRDDIWNIVTVNEKDAISMDLLAEDKIVLNTDNFYSNTSNDIESTTLTVKEYYNLSPKDGTSYITENGLHINASNMSEANIFSIGLDVSDEAIHVVAKYVGP